MNKNSDCGENNEAEGEKVREDVKSQIYPVYTHNEKNEPNKRGAERERKRKM